MAKNLNKVIDRIKTVDTPRKAFNLLRTLGYAKSDMQLTRVATTYSIDGKYSGRLTVSLPTHGEAFVIHDGKRENDGVNWGFTSAFLNIGNTAAGANRELEKKMGLLIHLGVCEEGQEISMLQLACAFVVACHIEEQTCESEGFLRFEWNEFQGWFPVYPTDEHARPTVQPGEQTVN